MPQVKGAQYEKIARCFLEKKGLKCLHQNFHSRYGEIDLIMQDNKTLAFVEVKYRRNATHGFAAETVSEKKQVRIIQTAKHFLHTHRLWQMDCRFDVVAIDGAPTYDGDMNIEWLRAAFQLS